jgi:DNA helicase HerA-like ATPase
VSNPAADDRVEGSPGGRVLSVRGSQAVIGVADGEWSEPAQTRMRVGGFVGIRTTDGLVVGMVTDTSVQSTPIAREQGFTIELVIDLMGEIRTGRGEDARFSRGLTAYPAIGDHASPLTQDSLRAIFDVSARDAIEVGALIHDGALPACVNVEDMISRHFAILGSTGVGKSSAVAVVVGEVLVRRPDLRIFLIDPHNEYGRCFGEQAQALNPSNLKLPFWLFSFEEIVEVLFRGREPDDEERDILAEVIPVARAAYVVGNREAPERTVRKGESRQTFTVDTPVPYRLADVMALVEERMGRLETRVARGAYLRLLNRIDGIVADPRYAFMFENANVGGDTMGRLLQQLFRLPADGKPMTIMQLAGFPSEVIDAVVSVLARLAFDFGLWSDGRLPLLFVCEEAHRYAPADRNVGFAPTRRAISRIAKEGRKYGVYLGLVTQRPAELDATIVSQCSTLFVMRMANERDQDLVRSAVSDAAASLLAFLPTLGRREAFAFGEGVAAPTRLVFTQLPQDRLPRSLAVAGDGAELGREVDEDFIEAVVERWRSATLSSRTRPDWVEPVTVALPKSAQPTNEHRRDYDRNGLLKKSTNRF